MTVDITAVEPESPDAVAPVVSDESTTDDAPYGYMTDPETGEKRPKKRPGRRARSVRPPSGKTPAITELQALGSVSDASEDTAPSAPARGRRARREKSPPPALPPFRAGVIAKGVNRLYRRAGRLIRMWDMELGNAVVYSATRRPRDEDDEDDEDLTVGEAWENLAKTNPRIRAFLLRLMVGGAWGGLFMAHMPLLMAIAMKPAIRDRIPFMELADAFLMDEPEGGGEAVPSGMAQMMGGIGPQDMAQMMEFAQSMMGGMVNGTGGRAPNAPREPSAESA